MKEKLQRNNVAIYCRLSVDDGNIEDSQSVVNQKQILVEYAKQQGWTIVGIYIDDGYSGTNFNRPEFKRMISDIESGVVDIVLTKDLSRLGRDYIVTGQLIDQYFPDKNVRYIALNDNVDTNTGVDDFLPFKNIINEWYAKDISKKIRAVKKQQMIKGEFKRTGIPLYGYMYDENSRRIINPDTAQVVREIFSLYHEGYSLKTIADDLTSRGVLTPKGYYKSINPSYKGEVKNPYIWTSQMIKAIITNREYLGHMILGKTASRFKSNKVIHVPEEEQHVFENVFEAIVSEEVFSTAQNTSSYNLNNNGLINPFFRITKCAVCGGNVRLYKKFGGASKSYEERLMCTNSNEAGKASIKLDDLKEVIKQELNFLKDIILEHEEEFKLKLLAKIEGKKKAVIPTDDEIKKRKLEARSKNLDSYIKALFEKNVLEPMPGDTYLTMMKEYTNEKKMIEEELKRGVVITAEEVNETEILKQYKSLINSLKKINEDNILSNSIIKNVISEIRLSTYKEEGSSKLGKIVEIKYMMIDDFIKEFIKEKRNVDAADGK